MKKLLLIIAIITPLLCNAEIISFGFATHHFSDNDKFNNNNQLIMLQKDKMILSTFINSQGHRTYAAGSTLKITSFANIDYGISYGYDIDCFKHSVCYAEEYEPSFVPIAALRLHHQVGPVIAQVTAAYFVNFSLGFEF